VVGPPAAWGPCFSIISRNSSSVFCCSEGVNTSAPPLLPLAPALEGAAVAAAPLAALEPPLLLLLVL
jgi:hypothetical protein